MCLGGANETLGWKSPGGDFTFLEVFAATAISNNVFCNIVKYTFR